MATSEEEFSPRERAILDEIIRYYMETQEAISARTLSKVSRLALSPTTIRNLMEDLSTAGLLTSEGVARGRIPTQKAFVIHVMDLGRRKPAREAEPPHIQPLEEGRPARAHEMVDHLGEHLAHQSGLVVLAALPSHDHYPLDWVRFSAIERGRVLVTLQTLYGELWSKLLVSPTPFPDDLLREVARFINEHYRGAPLDKIRSDIMAGEPKALLASMPSLGAAFRLLRKAFEWPGRPERPVWGLEHLFRIPECNHPGQLHYLHKAIRDPDLLSSGFAGGRVIDDAWISIGTETGYPGLEHCALVGYPISWGNWNGVLAMLGPMRMDYGAVFSMLRQGATLLNNHLETSVRESGFRG